MSSQHGDMVQAAFIAVSQAKGAKQKLDTLKSLGKSLGERDPAALELFKQVLRFAYDDDIVLGFTMPGAGAKYAIPEKSAAKPFGNWVFRRLEELAEMSGAGSRGNREAALKEVIENLKAHGHETLLTYMVGKDCRCGIGSSLIVKAFPGLIATFDVQLAHSFDAKKVKQWPVGVEPKYDGMRVISKVLPGLVVNTSRNGKPISSLDAMADEVQALAKAMGETHIYFDGEGMGDSFAESLSEVKSSGAAGAQVFFHVFDHMPGDFLRLSDAEILEKHGTFSERRARLVAAFAKLPSLLGKEPEWLKMSPIYYASNDDEVMHFYHAFRRKKYEGIIVKDLSAGYQKKRTIAWMKIKAQETLDLPVIGAFEGVGQFEGMLGGLVVDHLGVEVRIGGGYSNSERAAYWGIIQKDLELAHHDKHHECALLGKLIEVSFQEVTPDGSLRHPNFIRTRLDKSGTSNSGSY